MKKKIFLLAFMFMVPTIVFAASGDASLSIEAALLMEAFISIHMSLFVLLPLSKLFSQENSNSLFWKLFLIRVGILLLFDFFITTFIAIVDFLMLFIGVFVVLPICAFIMRKKLNFTFVKRQIGNSDFSGMSSVGEEIVRKCAKCGNTLKVEDKYCPNCGESLDENKVIASTNPKVFVHSSDFDPMFNLTEEKLLEEFIHKELIKANINLKDKLYPTELLKRKNLLNVLFSLLIFVYVSLIFFHFPVYTYIAGFLILLIFVKLTSRYNMIRYLKKEIKARPSEKISNIVMSVKNSYVPDHSKPLRIVSMLVAFLLPLFLFMNPRILYEKVENGYAVRFYTFGLTNFKTATIPSTYKGEKVVVLRGNAFSNMPFLKKVTLPDTITEIRGQAFKNDIQLKEVRISKSLQYLGGGAFYNCKSLDQVILPDTLTYMGGEVFYGATSLNYVRLSENLMEIRGNSFENCTSLKSIHIPSNITRIGGHAFYGNTSLSTVSFDANSKLSEIGSSAFRRCYQLYHVTLPKGVYVNERAFKESPTRIDYYNY